MKIEDISSKRGLGINEGRYSITIGYLWFKESYNLLQVIMLQDSTNTQVPSSDRITSLCEYSSVSVA